MALLALYALAPVGCSDPGPRYLRQPLVIATQEPYHHRPSGVVFPATVAGFRRLGMLQYDVEGLDVSGAYVLDAPPAGLTASVFVYPVSRPAGADSPRTTGPGALRSQCQDEFHVRKWQLFRAHPGSRILQEGTTAASSGNAMPLAHYAVIAYDGMWEGRSKTVIARLYVFCPVGERWILKHRFTHPDTFDADPSVERFLHVWAGASNGPGPAR